LKRISNVQHGTLNHEEGKQYEKTRKEDAYNNKDEYKIPS